ncbi:AMP-binding enzyme [Actinosynnema sp. CA-299493]
MAYDDVEAEILAHPRVVECVVTTIPVGRRKDVLVAYVVATGYIDLERVRAFLSAPRLRYSRIPRAVIPLDSLPRTSSGEVDLEGLPLPVLPGRAMGGKGAWSDGDVTPRGGLYLGGIVAVLAFLLTDLIWPGSTDLSAVPQPWAGLFTGLYVAECLSFGAGIGFLSAGRGRVTGLGRSPWLTTSAHLSIVWLLVAWWPQDNFYRLVAKNDWGRQAALVYGFNITLMIAAAVLVVFAARDRRVA